MTENTRPLRDFMQSLPTGSPARLVGTDLTAINVSALLQDSISSVSAGVGISINPANPKNPIISVDSAIADGAAAGTTAVQPGDLADVATTGSYNDLDDKPSIPPAQVNSDWNASSGVAQILNKPNFGVLAFEDSITVSEISAAGTPSSTTYLRGDGTWATPAGGSAATIQGPTATILGATVTYKITNFSSFSEYSVSATDGTASIDGDEITFIAPLDEGAVTITVTTDEYEADFEVEIRGPYIPTPAATPANFGDAFEGGFYAGMIWNELIQSATSTAIATGSKTFSVPSMTGPVTYIGHQIEVRSRANPANKMIGTVTEANLSAKTITVSVTSVEGSGTFSDWSIMSRYRVIVAPKASGENSSIALKNAQTALPSACQTVTEGFASTMAMFEADTSTVYPAAHWARGLSINGRTDWYIPARDELELAYRNLKPVTTDNSTDSRGSTLNYENKGSYGDGTDTYGVNRNSSPTGSAYTTSVPARTSVTEFRVGRTEVLAASYWTSSDYSTTAAYRQAFLLNPGTQAGIGKNVPNYARAVRRSII